MKFTRVLTLLFLAAASIAAEAKPVKVFVLAGQSNMEGQAVVDLKGRDYNDGNGTLEKLMQDPAKAALFAGLKDSEGKWVVREDVYVRYARENRPLLAGPLAFGFSVYGDVHHFGPELQFGHVVGDALENPVLLIKTAWGGKSLYRDFRPPSSGGEVGKYYTLMLAQVREALANLETEFPGTKGLGHELAGFVWYQGWNDGVNPQTAVPEYEQNLVNLIHDVRRDLNAPNLPVVIGELTGAWVNAPPEWEKLRAAQAAAAKRPEFAGNVVFVPTRDFVRKAEDSPNTGHGHHEFGNAETYFLVGDALGKGMMSLLRGGDFKLSSPVDYQVIQRHSKTTGSIPIAGKFSGTAIEARIGGKGEWKRLDAQFSKGEFHSLMEAPAGGWHRVEVRALKDGAVVGQVSVAHVGVGEVFVVAGQSNSANHGEEKQTTQTGRVASFDGQRWQLADDPQPGASGRGGSFMPPLGDLLVQRLKVPVGFIACGIGATSVREWLPKGATFPAPPTIESRVQKRPDGAWESNGAAYDAFVNRMKQAGPQGFRAVLWHQGESDANQKDATRTLPGKLYRDSLERVIRESRRDIGWEAPWFVAQVSYHVPGDEASPDIRAAQASLWKDGIAFEGPDSDALKGELRERKGQGVHFSGAGLREHAAKWAEKMAPWLEQQLK
jgi:hypothetical protein